MNKYVKIICIPLGVLYFIYLILAYSGIFRGYNNPTTANEPNLKMGSKMFVSNLKSPKKNDFICFNVEDEYLGKYISTFRLCAIENDTIEIKNGTVYINHKNIDANINLLHLYKIGKNLYLKLKQKNVLENHMMIDRSSNDSINVFLSTNILKDYQINSTRILSKKEGYLKRFISQKWTKDNFGPYIIPKNKFFVLGDNRDNSLDSRFIGLVDKTDIVGVVIKTFN